MKNGLAAGKEVRNRCGGLLRGLLHCDACNAAMVHTYTTAAANAPNLRKRSRAAEFVVVLACRIPARGATRIDPMPALRAE